jgi:metal-responsive CopG/Arc/MetJ family transcriptional regulator
VVCSDRIVNMKTIAITIDEDILERLDSLLRQRGSSAVSRSKLIREAVREYIDRLERRAEEARETAIVRRHRDRLTRQAKALIEDQAEP